MISHQSKYDTRTLLGLLKCNAEASTLYIAGRRFSFSSESLAAMGKTSLAAACAHAQHS